MARSTQLRLIDLGEHCDGESRDACLRIDDHGHASLLPEADPDDCEAVALVPADRISLVTVELPPMSPARLGQALRWAVEDRIAGDPAEQHVVPLRRISDEKLQCMVVARDDMRRWLDRVGRRPARMLPDAACLPWQPGRVVLAQAADAVLARWGETDFDRIPSDMLDMLLPELAEHGETIWLGPGPAPARIGDFATRSQDGGGRLELLAGVAVSALAAQLDLLRGEFAPADAAGDRRQQRWRVGLAAGVLVLLLGHALIDYALLKREQSQLNEQLENTAADLFPDIGALVRPRAQIERALAELRGVRRDRFVQLAAGANSLIAGAEGLRLDALSFADDVLELRLQAPSLSDLEALRRRADVLGLRAELGDVSVRSEATDARLVISGRTP